MGEEELEELFGQKEVLWVYRKEWDAYPKAGPMRGEDFARVHLAQGALSFSS